MVDETQLQDQPEPHQPVTFTDGQYYATNGPNNESCVIMTRKTWLDYGTLLESMRRANKDLDARCKELADESKSRGEALENLREVRRSEKRPEIEHGLVLPGSREFNKRKMK